MWDFVDHDAGSIALYGDLHVYPFLTTGAVIDRSFLAFDFCGFIPYFTIFQGTAMNVGLIELVSHLTIN